MRVISDSRGPGILPGGLDDPGNLAGQGKLAELDSGDAELAVKAAGAAAHGAAVADARGRGILGQLLELGLRGEELFVHLNRIWRHQLDPAEKYHAFFAVLQRDASDSLAAIELVLAQPAIGSPLIDNLNASIHLRALLTDLFLLTEIAKIQRTPAKPMASGG